MTNGEKEFESSNEETNPADSQSGEGHIIDETSGSGNGRVKRRIKVRKKIRVRKKPSAKKKLKKYGERIFWFLIVAGFITALIVMVIELDLRDDRLKKQKKRTNQTRMMM